MKNTLHNISVKKRAKVTIDFENCLNIFLKIWSWQIKGWSIPSKLRNEIDRNTKRMPPINTLGLSHLGQCLNNVLSRCMWSDYIRPLG